MRGSDIICFYGFACFSLHICPGIRSLSNAFETGEPSASGLKLTGVGSEKSFEPLCEDGGEARRRTRSE